MLMFIKGNKIIPQGVSEAGTSFTMTASSTLNFKLENSTKLTM